MGEERTDEVKRRRHTPEQIIRKLREADRMLAEGAEVPEVAKALEVSDLMLEVSDLMLEVSDLILPAGAGSPNASIRSRAVFPARTVDS